MQSAIDVAGIEVKQLPCRYPQGAEKVLIETCTGREVPFPGLPSDVGRDRDERHLHPPLWAST